ncbi:hypothetical protein [Streptomyces palmae]|uniref:Lipoprotein n=1 Tax=Streptomyces palmae TaxID=1701085 RepID=A0A4Z0HC71_9ACTN|nr:hypothetical protein [Streptomyces palmae]TGB17195.1 hypothetical protein E4099_03955 [Streptomyces palmae]
MARKKLPLATTAAITAVLALTAGCGSDGGSSADDGKSGAAIGKAMAELPVKPTAPPTTPPPTDEPSDEPTGGNPLVTPDVRMGDCGWDSGNMPYAQVKIKNSSSTKQDYSIWVAFTDKDDEIVTSGISTGSILVDGKGSKTVTIKGLKADAGKKAKTCKITLANKKAAAG